MSLRDDLLQMGIRARQASWALARLSSQTKDDALQAMADGLEAARTELQEVNRRDLDAARAAGLSAAMIDRLTLSDGVIAGMAQGLREVAALPDPVGEVTGMWKRPNGLMVGKKRVPLGVIAMNEPSATKFGSRVRAGGVLVINASLVSAGVTGPEGVRVIRVPCNELALELGDARVASMVALGAYVAASGVVEVASIEAALPEVLPQRAHKLIPLNLQAVAAGVCQVTGA